MDGRQICAVLKSIGLDLSYAVGQGELIQTAICKHHSRYRCQSLTKTESFERGAAIESTLCEFQILR